MNQLNLFDTASRKDQDGNELAHVEPRRPRFGGDTYDEARDGERVGGALERVYALMRDGRKRTLPEIAEGAGCSEAGASARFRDFRKAKHRAQFPDVADAMSEHQGGGVWVYWLVIRTGNDGAER